MGVIIIPNDEAGGMHPLMHLFTQFTFIMCILYASLMLGDVGKKMRKHSLYFKRITCFSSCSFFLTFFFLPIFNEI